VRYLSPADATGYGQAAHNLLRALADLGADVGWQPFLPGRGWDLGYEPVAVDPSGDRQLDRLLGSAADDVVVVHLPPEYFPRARAEHPAARLVGHTVWETDRLPRHWPALLEVPDVLVVPCRWNAEVIRAAGVRTPVEVVPHVVPPPSPTAPLPGLAVDDRFVFYTIASWTVRKAVDRTVRAYLDAFTADDPVVLVVKTTVIDTTTAAPSKRGLLTPGTTARAMAELLAGHRSPPEVVVLAEDLPETAIAGLHARGDCLVSLCRSEGWGLTLSEAASWANPVVVTGYGGHLDYLDQTTAFLVDHELVPVVDPGGVPSFTPDQRWAEPSVDHAAGLLRKVVEEPALARARGEAARARVVERYGPRTVAEAFLAAVASP
jgi:glycosyltransferase involved in cell wall biosynthesis